jgi:hypothetical protein
MVIQNRFADIVAIEPGFKQPQKIVDSACFQGHPLLNRATG